MTTGEKAWHSAYSVAQHSYMQGGGPRRQHYDIVDYIPQSGAKSLATGFFRPSIIDIVWLTITPAV